jgi:hypothetical protein
MAEYPAICRVYLKLAGDLTMQSKTRRLTAWVAIVAIGLQAALSGLAGSPPAAAATFDRNIVICHGTPADGPAKPQAPASHDECCNQCVLCNAAAAAVVPAATPLPSPQPPVGTSFVPFSSTEPSARDRSGLKLARGPPRAV